MGRQCCVKGCYNKQPSAVNITIFKAPKCADSLNKWSELLNSKITPFSYVCEEHFNICDVKSAEIVRDAAGNVIYKYEFKKKVLAKGAVPLKRMNTIIDEESGKPPEKIMKITCTETTRTEEVPSKEREVEEVAGIGNIFKEILQNEVDFQDADSTLAEITDMHENLYDTIVQHKVEIKLPTAEWGFHCSLNNKLIIFSEVKIFADPFGNENDVIPIYTKQVIINNFSRVQLRFLGKMMLECTKSNPESVEDLENLLLEIDALKICPGGPSKKYYKSIRLECASRDEISWRHNKCPLIIASGSICKHCASLHNILTQNMIRKKNLNKRRIRITASPTIKSKIKNISSRRRVVQQHLNRKETSFNRVSEELTKVHARFINIKEKVLDEEIKKLSSKLPQNQLVLIKECLAVAKVKNIKARRYSHEWLLLCLLLHIRSSATYNMLRNNGILPLPAKSTITKYLHESNTGCGFDARFFALFKKQLECYPPMARSGIISFDEILVRSSIEVDMKTMTFNGLQDFGAQSEESSNINNQADHGLVFMFSSLSYNFHQPIAMFGSKGTTKTNILAVLLLEAILQVEKAGGKVHGIVCDGASTNRSLWKQFGISGDINNCKFCFQNPYDENRVIYAFSDAPHLIKCIRNRLEQNKILRTNSGTVRWGYYKSLYSRDSQNTLRVCPKITENHVSLSHAMKMRVSLATQLFSNSVADGLQYYLEVERREKPETKVFEGCEATIRFTKQINDLFDALNRSFPLEGIRPGSEDLEVIKKAITWLDDWEKNKIREAEYLTASTSQGLRVTLLSTLHLCNELLSQYDFKYILTNKMNQDCLEKFFGIIRQAGCQNDHPTFTSFMQLYHLLSMYKILKPPKFGNCTVREFTEEERPSITLKEFKNIFQEKNMSHKQVHIGNLKKKLDHLIEFTEWECDEIIEYDYEMNEVMSCILYYITGYICRRMLKITKCESCRSAFISRYENIFSNCPESELVTVKSRGGLIHPNVHLVQIFKKIEISFQNHLNSTNVYELVINDLLSEKFSFPCIMHKEYTVAYCIHYYLTLRMRQIARIKNRERSKSKDTKKTAKLYNK